MLYKGSPVNWRKVAAWSFALLIAGSIVGLGYYVAVLIRNAAP